MNKYIIFNIGESRYGINILEIRRLIDNQKVSRIPEIPVSCLGVTTVREELWNIFDLNYVLNEQYTPDKDNPDYKIMLMDDGHTGFLIGKIERIEEIPEDCIDQVGFDIGKSKRVAKRNRSIGDGKNGSAAAKEYDDIIVLLDKDFLQASVSVAPEKEETVEVEVE